MGKGGGGESGVHVPPNFFAACIDLDTFIFSVFFTASFASSYSN